MIGENASLAHLYSPGLREDGSGLYSPCVGQGGRRGQFDHLDVLRVDCGRGRCRQPPRLDLHWAYGELLLSKYAEAADAAGRYDGSGHRIASRRRRLNRVDRNGNDLSHARLRIRLHRLDLDGLLMSPGPRGHRDGDWAVVRLLLLSLLLQLSFTEAGDQLRRLRAAQHGRLRVRVQRSRRRTGHDQRLQHNSKDKGQ
jgi:hypothetical protein